MSHHEQFPPNIEQSQTRRALRRLRGEMASARTEIDDLRAELDCLIEHHRDQIARLRADLRNLTEWLFSTETVYPVDGPPEVADVEIVDPYEDASLPVESEPVLDGQEVCRE